MGSLGFNSVNLGLSGLIGFEEVEMERTDRQTDGQTKRVYLQCIEILSDIKIKKNK